MDDWLLFKVETNERKIMAVWGDELHKYKGTRKYDSYK